MPKFLIQFLAAFIPVKSWRKNFRKKMNRNNLFGDLKTVFTEIKTKRDTVLMHKDSCQIIALGSSHGAYGLNPEFIGKNCFNLCTNSQDLYTSKEVLKYMQQKLPHLKTVLVCLDVFTRGWCLERTSAAHICASYQYLYGIRYPLFKDNHRYLKTCEKLDKQTLQFTANKNGYLYPNPLNLTDSLQTRIQGHLREHNREQSQYHYLTEMIQSLGRDINLYILIAPVRSDYQKSLPKNLL